MHLVVLLISLVIFSANAEDDTAGPVFLKEPPNRVDFSNTTGAVVECSASGNPPPDIIWVRSDGTAVGDVPGLRQVLANGNLVFPPFRAEDYRQEVHAQIYACLAKNSIGSIHSRDVNVRAVVQQFYNSRVIDEYVLKGNTGILKCLVPSFVSDFIQIESWVADDGTEISYETRDSSNLDSKYLVLPSGELHIRDVGPEDGYKSYQCRTKHRLTGETRLSATKGRLVITEPTNNVPPKKVGEQFEGWKIIFVAKRDTAWLPCQVTGYPVPRFLWYKFIDGTSRKQAVVLNDRVKQVAGTLIIREAKVEDSGKYLCVVNNSVGGESVETVLTVTAPLKATIEPKVQTVDFGRPAVFSCKFEGNPIKTISWMKDGNKIDHTDAVLRIEAVRKEDKGMYQCFIRNDQESAEATGELKLGGRFEPPQIRHAFNEETVQPGNSVFMKCIASGNPTPEITWELYGRKLSNSDRYQIGQYVTVNGDVVSHLNITGIHTNDGGLYRCVASSKVGSVDHSARVNVYGLPFVRSMEKQAIVAGGTLIVHCPFAGHPVETVVWERDGRLLPINRKQKVFPNGTLIIENVERASDQATYVCVAKNSQGYSARGSLEVQVMVPPQITPFTFGTEVVNSGDMASTQCAVAKGDLPLKIHWLFNNRTVEVLPGINVGQYNKRISSLSIDSATHIHSGTYECTAENSAGRSSYWAILNVNVPPQIHPFDFGSESVFSGELVTTTCAVTKGDLPLKIIWFFNNEPIDSLHGTTVGQLNPKMSTLSIESVSEIHSGEFLCIAENPAGKSSYSAILNVKVPPRWILEPTDKAFAQGSDAAVECKADGFPKPVVTWKKATGVSPGDYKDFKQNDPDIKVEDGTLVINNIQKTNEGYYLCEAVNGIGSGLSAVVFISVQAPPQFEVKFRNQTSRRGDPAVLQCEAKGEKPIGILWNINNKRLEPKGDNRYTIREEILPNGVLSDLSIKRTERIDSALFTCVATNAFGSDDTNINMIVQEVPEVPYGLKVLDKSGKTVQLSWVAPYDGNSPIKKYIIEYKPSKGSWEKNSERVLIPGDQTEAGIFTLRPATTYHIRIVAENEIGSSEPSDTVTIITAEEVPGGPPTNIRVDAEDQHSLVVYWKPPLRDHWNGDIQGYYVGYKLANTDKPYLFETVEFPREEENKEHYLKISNLKTYTQYSVVVQAFNKVGAGPTSEEIKATTAEGVPEQPPDKATCTTLTAQTIRVSWVSPPLTAANGIIKGYKVIYGPSDSWFDENTKDTKITASSETILHGLKKFTNYSMEVLAYTSGGDGVRTPPIACQTEQDVPEAPIAVKALVMSSDSILASWKPPVEPNGIIEYYMVYYKESGNGDEKPKSQKIVPNIRNQNLSFQAKNLDSALKYEFWVTAATTIGEGQPSKKVVVSPSTSVPAKTASFDDTFTTTYKEDVTLPCLAVGVPPPVITWTIKGIKFNVNSNDRMRQQPDGSLFIRDVTRTDAGEYSCRVENDFGQDSVTHQLIVNAPPRAPQVILISTTTNSLTIKIKPHESDEDQIHGYTIHYKPEFGDWETVQVGPATDKYTLEKLLCGTRYQLYVTAYNGIGTGDASDNLNPKTRGEKPIVPSADKFIEVSSNSITLHLGAWSDGGCPMLYFVIEHKKKTNAEWIQVSNNAKPGQNFVLLDLDAAVWYHLRVTAHNNAGFNVAEYEFATLTVTGGTIAPARDLPGVKMLFPWIPDWVEWNIAVPVAATVVVVVVGIVVVCVALSRKAHGPLQTRLRSDCMYDVVYNQSCNAASTLDKRRPDLRDELGYIAPPNRKLPPVPGSNYNTCDRIKRGTALRAHYRSHSTWDPRQRHLYEELRSRRGSNETVHTHRGMDDEICPYATFHLLGFREEIDPSKAMQFQTFPHPHAGTLGASGMNTPHQMHSRNGSQSMPRQNNRRYDRVGSQGNGSIYSPGPEYDDPANCAPEDEQYGSQYGGYGAPYDQYGSRGSIGRRSLGSLRIPPTSNSPEPPPPPPRNHDPSFNDSKDSNEISEAECDRDQLINSRSYGVMRGNAKDGMTHEEMRKLIERNETGQTAAANGGLTAYDTVAV
ncbi:cell adhesion molecule Dscam2 isoform X1 [Cylas formicarius]|uniref:cell adhesion molecule Dscam2 isoform X1 n=1 Tax=Cylas formicarius TaxID=197179 RepID=UPI0029589B41|nr:cell adhesion molecule Dscam2 isoform X1 [Cylas formicarius]